MVGFSAAERETLRLQMVQGLAPCRDRSHPQNRQSRLRECEVARNEERPTGGWERRRWGRLHGCGTSFFPPNAAEVGAGLAIIDCKLGSCHHTTTDAKLPGRGKEKETALDYVLNLLFSLLALELPGGRASSSHGNVGTRTRTLVCLLYFQNNKSSLLRLTDDSRRHSATRL